MIETINIKEANIVIDDLRNQVVSGYNILRVAGIKDFINHQNNLLSEAYKHITETIDCACPIEWLEGNEYVGGVSITHHMKNCIAYDAENYITEFGN